MSACWQLAGSFSGGMLATLCAAVTCYLRVLSHQLYLFVRVALEHARRTLGVALMAAVHAWLIVMHATDHLTTIQAYSSRYILRTHTCCMF